MMSAQVGHFVHRPSGSSLFSAGDVVFTPFLARCNQDIWVRALLPGWAPRGGRERPDYRLAPPGDKPFVASPTHRSPALPGADLCNLLSQNNLNTGMRVCEGFGLETRGRTNRPES